MSSDFAMGIAREALETMLLTRIPVLLVSLVVGVGISILQAVTQIQEQTINFVSKIAVTSIALLFLGHWMLDVISRFLSKILENFPYWIR